MQSQKNMKLLRKNLIKHQKNLCTENYLKLWRDITEGLSILRLILYPWVFSPSFCFVSFCLAENEKKISKIHREMQ